MSEVLDDLVAYVDAQVGSLAAGTNLFAAVMPEAPDAVVALVETPGPAPVEVFGSGAPPVETPRVQVLSRAPRADTAKTTSRLVWSALAGAPDGLIGGGDKRFLRVEIVQSPFLIGRDENDRAILGFGVQTWRAT